MSNHRTITRKDYTYGDVVGKQIPLSFGANFNDDPVCRTNLRKSHLLGDTDAQHPVKGEDLANFTASASYDVTKPTMVSSAQAYGAGASGAHLMPRDEFLRSTRTTSTATHADETVLRFLGYFTEAVHESPDESVRVHKVALLYHVADDTLLLREAAQMNSGLTQGVILKRQKVPKGDSYVTSTDLDIGATIDVFGKHVTLVDCSEATRRYISDRFGRDLAPAKPWPKEDTYTATTLAKLTTRPRRALPTTDFDHKRALEAMTGSGVISKHAPDDVRTAKQFLRNRINEHLQFAAYWDDRAKMSGDLRLVVIRYYVDNDTIEIVEQRAENSGREGAAKLLCRQRVPRSPLDPTSVQQNTYGLLVKNDYITFDDLDVGTEVTIADHHYVIYDADAFTRGWFKENRGKELQPAVDISATVAKGSKLAPMHFPPPHIGFGSEEDSLQSCKGLMLKPPHIDVEKMKREAGKVMIYNATLHNPTQPEDVGREFVVTFHRATDEVEIHERQLRNSGIVGGKFLAKGRHLKQLPDGRKVAYDPSDFTVGGQVRIAGRVFRLEAIDERSRRIVEGDVDEVSEARIRSLVVAFRELLNSKFYRAHEAYRAVAPEGNLTAVQVQDFFAKAAGDITNEEARLLVHHFSGGDGSGRVSYDRFLKLMDPGNTASLDAAVNNPKSVTNIEVFSRTSAEGLRNAETLRRTSETAAESAAVRRLHKSFATKLVQRRGTIQEAYRLLAGHAPSSRLSLASFRASLEEVLRISAPAREKQLLEETLFDTPDKKARGVDFKAFCEFVEAA